MSEPSSMNAPVRTTASEPIVTITGVSKIYRQGAIAVTALNNVSAQIGPGEFTALVGPSGSGKTTLLNLIGGLDVPDSGALTVAGHRLDEMSPAEITRLRLQRVGFVFQAYNLIPSLTARENVALLSLIHI